MEVGPSLVVEVTAGELGSVLDGSNAKVVSSEYVGVDVWDGTLVIVASLDPTAVVSVTEASEL